MTDNLEDNNNRAIRKVALAILEQDGKFLMQLRDDIPGIYYPGCWGLFGGHLELGETPEEALKREIQEEIDYCVPSLEKFRCYTNPEVIRYVYYVPLTVSLEQLDQQEGWDMALVAPEDIYQGQFYSTKADRIKPFGQIHQRILLDFLKVRL